MYIEPGTKIVNGAVVVHYTHQSDACGGAYAYGVALCLPDQGAAYAVWELVFAHERGEWRAGTGDYFQTATEFGRAVARYEARGGKFGFELR
jgi:hypothetical protein